MGTRGEQHSWFQGKRIPLYFVVGGSLICTPPSELTLWPAVKQLQAQGTPAFLRHAKPVR